MPNSLFETPRFQPKARSGFLQMLGIFFFFSFPVLALLGVFGQSEVFYHQSESGLEVWIEYPARGRVGKAEVVSVQIKNLTSSNIENIKVRFEYATIESMIEARFSPDADAHLSVEVGDLASGMEKTVSLYLKPKSYGSMNGNIQILKDNQMILSPELNVFIFP